MDLYIILGLERSATLSDVGVRIADLPASTIPVSIQVTVIQRVSLAVLPRPIRSSAIPSNDSAMTAAAA